MMNKISVNRLTRLLQPQVVVIGALLILCIRLFSYTARFAVNMMFWDQWFVWAPFFDQRDWVSAFRLQHGPHRQGLGSFLIYGVAQLSRWDGRADAYLVATVLCLAGALALVLKRRYVGSFAYIDVIIPLLFLNLNQWETLTVVSNVSHSALPLLLIMLYAIVLTFQSALIQTSLLLVANFLLLYTGFGIFAAFVTPLLFLLRAIFPAKMGFERASRWLWAAGFALSIVSLLTFFSDWIFTTAVTCAVLPHPKPWEYLIFAGLQISQGFGLAPIADHLIAANTLTLILGLAIALASTIVIFISTASRRAAAPAFLAAFSLLFVGGTAVGRVCLSATEQPLQSKYATLVLPLILGIYLWVSAHRPQWRAITGGSICGLIILGQVPPFFRDPYAVLPQFYYDAKTKWKACYLAHYQTKECDDAAGFPMAPNGSQLVLQRLRMLEKGHLNLFKELPSDIQITTPVDDSVLTDPNMVLKGTVDPLGFERYEVQWGRGEFPETWEWLSGPHKGAVRDAELTHWDMSVLPSGLYTIRVTTYLQDGTWGVAMTRFRWKPAV